MHHFHPFSSSFASAAILHFHTSCTSPLCAQLAPAAQMCPTSSTPSPGHCQPHRSPLADTQMGRGFLSRNQTFRGQVRARGPAPRARLQAAGAAKATLPSKPSLLLPPSMTVGGKMHSSEESKFEQLSSNERFVPPWGCFINYLVFLVEDEQSKSGKHQKHFKLKTILK